MQSDNESSSISLFILGGVLLGIGLWSYFQRFIQSDMAIVVIVLSMMLIGSGISLRSN